MTEKDVLFAQFLCKISRLLIPLEEFVNFSVVLRGTKIVFHCDRQHLARELNEILYDQDNFSHHIWCKGYHYAEREIQS